MSSPPAVPSLQRYSIASACQTADYRRSPDVGAIIATLVPQPGCRSSDLWTRKTLEGAGGAVPRCCSAAVPQCCGSALEAAGVERREDPSHVGACLGKRRDA